MTDVATPAADRRTSSMSSSGTPDANAIFGAAHGVTGSPRLCQHAPCCVCGVTDWLQMHTRSGDAAPQGQEKTTGGV